MSQETCHHCGSVTQKVVHFPKKDAGVHQFGGGPEGGDREQQRAPGSPKEFWENRRMPHRRVGSPECSSWSRRRTRSQGHGHVLVQRGATGSPDVGLEPSGGD